MSTPTTPKTPIPPTLPAGITKICHIVKRDDFDGYGFNLHSEKTKPGQFIGKVDPKSPAEAAGLKEGDRILEVNGVSIGSETHKQVVARIKAIACEVRLLLIDVDGKGDEAMAMVKAMNGNVACANDEKSESKAEQCERNSSSDNGGIKQEMPGASANISSISMVSTKRASNSSVSNQSGSSTLNMDMVDKAAVPATQQHNGFSVEKHTKDEQQQQQMMMIEKTAAINNNNNNTLMTTPPPPSAAVAMPNNNKNNNMIYSTTTTTTTKTATTNGNGHGIVAGNNTPPTTPPSPSSPSITTTTTTTTAAAATRPGGLNLPLTAAEMRAKLASKKKYDPKNESVDLKKKFEIIQKL